MPIMFLAEGAADVTTTGKQAVESVLSSLTSNFNVSTIAEYIGIGIAAAAGLFLFWWGARKVVRMLTAAFKKGRIAL